jgi:hypothetical protein
VHLVTTHLVVQIVTLSGSLTDTGEDGVTSVSLGDVVNELCGSRRTSAIAFFLHRKIDMPPVPELTLNQDGLSDTGTTEQTNLSSSGVRSQQVDDLDTGLQNLGDDRLVNERRSVGVDGGHLDSLDWASVVDGLTDDVHDSTAGRRK